MFDDVARDEAVAPLQGAGADVREESLVGFVEGRVGVGRKVVGKLGVVELHLIDGVREGFDQGERLCLGEVGHEQRPDLKVALYVVRVGVATSIGDVGGDGVPHVEEGPELVGGKNISKVHGEDCAADLEIGEDLKRDGFHVRNGTASPTTAQEPVQVRIALWSGREACTVCENAFGFKDFVCGQSKLGGRRSMASREDVAARKSNSRTLPSNSHVAL